MQWKESLEDFLLIQRTVMIIFMTGFRQYKMIKQLLYQAFPVRHLRYPIGL
jgi:hypothetical protein